MKNVNYIFENAITITINQVKLLRWDTFQGLLIEQDECEVWTIWSRNSLFDNIPPI